MSTFPGRRLYLIAALSLAVVTSGYAVTRYLSGVSPHDELFRVYGVVMLVLIVTWLVTDPVIPAAHRPSFDHAMFVWITFPLLAAYHMYSAYRWRGLLIVLGLFGLFVAPNIALALAYIVG
jgi:hypothetical protein